MVAGNVQHNVKLIFQVFALDGGKPQLDRLHFAALIGLQGIVLLDAQGADGVAGDRKDGIDHGVLQLARRVPGSVAVLAALGGGDRILVFQHTACTGPCVGQAVHDDNAVRADNIGPHPDVLNVLFHTVGRVHVCVQELPGGDGQVAAGGVFQGAVVFGIDQGNFAPVPGHAIGNVQGAESFAAAGYPLQRHAQLGFLPCGRGKQIQRFRHQVSSF